MNELESQLAKLTEPAPAEGTPLWERALEQTDAESDERVRRASVLTVFARPGLWFSAAAALLLMAGVLTLPNLGDRFDLAEGRRGVTMDDLDNDRAQDLRWLDEAASGLAMRSAEPASATNRWVENFALGREAAQAELAGPSQTVLLDNDDPRWQYNFDPNAPSRAGVEYQRQYTDAEQESADTISWTAIRQPQPVVRLVARTGSMNLEVETVRDASAAIASMIDAPAGEYIQSRRVRGEGGDATARLVLRVADARLESVMDAVSDLGEVGASGIESQDLTDSIVDVESRLRNERRVETELLELLDRWTAPDAARGEDPLRDILAVRGELSRVRLGIERMDASRAKMLRRVRLATLTVALEGADEDDAGRPATERPGPLERFADDLAGAAGDGLWSIAASATWLTRALVSIAPWALIAGLALWLAWRRVRRSRPAPLPE